MQGVVLTMTPNYIFKRNITKLRPASNNLITIVDLPQLVAPTTSKVNGCCSFRVIL